MISDLFYPDELRDLILELQQNGQLNEKNLNHPIKYWLFSVLFIPLIIIAAIAHEDSIYFMLLITCIVLFVNYKMIMLQIYHTTCPATYGVKRQAQIMAIDRYWGSFATWGWYLSYYEYKTDCGELVKKKIFSPTFPFNKDDLLPIRINILVDPYEQTRSVPMFRSTLQAHSLKKLESYNPEDVIND